MTDKSGQLTITEAIELLKDYRKGDFVDDYKLCEAIDTVLSHINTGNKTGLYDRLQEKSIEVSDSQEGLSNKKDMELPSDEQIEQYALKNILNGVGIQSMKNTKAWIAGATWMRDLRRETTECKCEHSSWNRDAGCMVCDECDKRI